VALDMQPAVIMHLLARVHQGSSTRQPVYAAACDGCPGGGYAHKASARVRCAMRANSTGHAGCASSASSMLIPKLPAAAHHSPNIYYAGVARLAHVLSWRPSAVVHAFMPGAKHSACPALYCCMSCCCCPCTAPKVHGVSHMLRTSTSIVAVPLAPIARTDNVGLPGANAAPTVLL
jgi:hypothetical protein